MLAFRSAVQNSSGDVVMEIWIFQNSRKTKFFGSLSCACGKVEFCVGFRNPGIPSIIFCVFYGCHYCKGEKGCPQASSGSISCISNQCKKQHSVANAKSKQARMT